ncbi:MAG: SGNH/GDSL hydrolase family protein [Cyclobacteriaceae bacterium]|nr:SGNH/GDSL hydrolase family protein [Cyclobacteriaceae bacterium]
MKRRNFIRNISLGSGIALSSPSFSTEKSILEKPQTPPKIILFQGDSITDASRNKSIATYNNPDSLGNGYAFLAASDLLEKFPHENLQIYNRGISGNKVFELAKRWKEDCLDLKPDVLSILIGVNDFWHTLDLGYSGTIQTYRDDFKAILDQTLTAFPEIKIIIGEPFVIQGGEAITDRWFPDFDGYRTVAKELSKEFNTTFIPYQKLFDNALERADYNHWGRDGVHPSIAGARLMANAWGHAYSLL